MSNGPQSNSSMTLGDPDNKGSTPATVASLAKFAATAALGLTLGFAGVYFTVGPTANAPQLANAASSETTGRDNANTAAAPRAQANGLKALSVGEMEMFVFREPQALPAISFVDGEGQKRSFSDWKGRITLVNLWATWCAPCRKEMGDLDRLQAQLGGDNFEVVAISLDRGSDQAPREFLDEIGARNLAFYHDPTARIGTKLGTIGMPATILIGRDGTELGRMVGPADWDSADAVRLIENVIAKQS